MRNLTRKASLSQAEVTRLKKVQTAVQRAFPWRQDALGVVLPCEAMGMCSESCAVSSASQIIKHLRGLASCPNGEPIGCPYRTVEKTPDS